MKEAKNPQPTDWARELIEKALNANRVPEPPADFEERLLESLESVPVRGGRWRYAWALGGIAALAAIALVLIVGPPFENPAPPVQRVAVPESTAAPTPERAVATAQSASPKVAPNRQRPLPRPVVGTRKTGPARQAVFPTPRPLASRQKQAIELLLAMYRAAPERFAQSAIDEGPLEVRPLTQPPLTAPPLPRVSNLQNEQGGE